MTVSLKSDASPTHCPLTTHNKHHEDTRPTKVWTWAATSLSPLAFQVVFFPLLLCIEPPTLESQTYLFSLLDWQFAPSRKATAQLDTVSWPCRQRDGLLAIISVPSRKENTNMETVSTLCHSKQGEPAARKSETWRLHNNGLHLTFLVAALSTGAAAAAGRCESERPSDSADKKKK